MSRSVVPAILIREMYAAAVAAADPRPLVRGALADEVVPPGPVYLVAVGKAADGMAAGAVDSLACSGRRFAGGVIAGGDETRASDPAIRRVSGDHPVPGARSMHAADAIGNLLAEMPPDASVWVLLSGGASSLIGAPVGGVSLTELRLIGSALLGSGLEIHDVNAVRGRLLRWGGGRLARALAPRPVRCLVLSDVVGNDLRTIGSGPCVPPADAGRFRSAIARLALPAGAERALLARVEAAATGEPGGGALAEYPHVRTSIVGDNRTALAGAARHARAAGVRVEVVDTALAGEARFAGAAIVTALETCRPATYVIWGGETTVTLGASHGGGGRSQELALAAAQRAGGATVSLLAGGTDGRDGPTDAAGAVIDGSTWRSIIAAGRDPNADLARHDAYAALDAVGALIRTGPTGTNVGDVVVACAG